MFVKFVVFALVAVASVHAVVVVTSTQFYVPWNGREFEEAQVISYELEALLRQVYDHGETKTEVQLEVFSGFFRKVEELLNKLDDKLRGALKSAVDSMTNTVDSLEEKTKGFIAILTERKNFRSQSLLAELERAKSKGQAARRCLEGFEDRIKNLPETELADAKSCAKAKIGKGKSIITGTTGEVERTLKSLKAMNKEFSDCRTGCYIKLAEKLAAEVVNIPPRIQREITKGLNLITNLESTLGSCMLVPDPEIRITCPYNEE